MRAIYPGPPGTFAHAACRLLIPGEELEACSSFEEVARKLSSRDADYGVLPSRNNIAGEIPGIGSLIERHRLCSIGSLDVPIRLHLMGLEGCSLDEIRLVVSHKVAIAQCMRSLSTLGVRIGEAESTSAAARDLSDVHAAALASMEAASLYGLKILRSDMQDRESITTFVLFRADG